MVLYCYHGTNEENSKSILKDGFREGTYFAYHLEDALTFGGQYVFLVEFDETKFKLPILVFPIGNLYSRQRILLL